jgi:adenylate cyclase
MIMAEEIERKFLVCGTGWQVEAPILTCQGYLNRDSQRTVRVRIAGEDAVITIKGLTTGATRQEFEYAIPVADARQIIGLCEGPLIEKKRHVVEYCGMTWEVDEFLGDNLGLVVAEVELTSEDQDFELPPWVGDEVTSDRRYYNSNLSQMPFNRWGARTTVGRDGV